MEREIKERPGIKVYANASGTISIAQEIMGDETIVVVDPTDIELLCRHLRDVRDELEQSNESSDPLASL